MRFSLLSALGPGKTLGTELFFDKEEQMLPTPQIVDYGLNLRLQTGSTFRQGDIILKGISLNQFSLKDLKTQTEDITEREVL